MTPEQRAKSLLNAESIDFEPDPMFVPKSLNSSNLVVGAGKSKNNKGRVLNKKQLARICLAIKDHPKGNKRQFSGEQSTIDGDVWMNNKFVITGPGVVKSKYHKIAALLRTWGHMYNYTVSLTNVHLVNWLIHGKISEPINPLVWAESVSNCFYEYKHGLLIRILLPHEPQHTNTLAKVVATIYWKKQPYPTFTIAGFNDKRHPKEYLRALAQILRDPIGSTHLLGECIPELDLQV